MPAQAASPTGAHSVGDGPTFSILIATYKHEQYIVETLDSVAAQTCPNYEIVIVNDGSPDNTIEIVNQWTTRFHQDHRNRVVLDTISNSGQPAALEHGFGLCTGKYICLLDSDDRWLPEKLERAAEVIREEPEAGLITHSFYVIDAEGHRTGDIRPKRAKLSEGDLREQIRRTGRIVTVGIIMRADIFRKLLPIPIKQYPNATDSYLTLGASLLARVKAIPEPVAEYRMHAGGDYIRHMLSPEGLKHWNERQLVIARHFGLENVTWKNSWFARNAFAVSKFEEGISQQVKNYGRLIYATLTDSAFNLLERFALAGYWTLCFVAPRPLFSRLWRSFQLRHTSGVAPAEAR